VRSPSARNEPLRSLRGRYELLDSLGRGADGMVYRALERNRQHLPEVPRYVAIKVLRNDPPFASDALIEYQRRARAWLAL
jgi:serine/threonine protein kinase